jgi:phosphohistidine phosphatase
MGKSIGGQRGPQTPRVPSAGRLDSEPAHSQFLRMPLVLDLVRHGEAEPAGAGDDRERKLTAAGRAAISRLATRMADAGSSPGFVFTSPLERALHTARILAAQVSPSPAIEVLDELEPHRDPSAVLDALARREMVTGHALLVGHLPMLDDLHELMTGAHAAFPVGILHRVIFVGGAQPWTGRPVLTLRP